MNNWKYLSIILIISIIGCRDDIEVTFEEPAKKVGTEDNWVVYKENALVSSVDTDSRLMEVGSNQLVFDGMSPQMDSLEIGSVLFSTIMPNAPRGYLVRITGIKEKNGTVVYETEPAGFPDIFEEWSFDLSTAFDGIRAKNNHNVLEGAFDNLELTIAPEQLSFHPGGNPNVTIGGEINAEFSGDLVLSFSGNSQGIQEFSAGLKNFSVTAGKLRVRINGDFAGGQDLLFDESDPIYEKIIAGPQLAAGPVPFQPVFQFEAFALSQIGAQADFGVDFTTRDPFDAFVTYTPQAGLNTHRTAINWDVKPLIQFTGEARMDFGFGIGVGVAPVNSAIMSLGVNTRMYTFMIGKGQATLNSDALPFDYTLSDFLNAFDPMGCFQWGVGIQPGVFIDVPMIGFISQALGGSTSSTTNYRMFQLDKSFINECTEPTICDNFSESNIQFLCDGVNPSLSVSVGDSSSMTSGSYMILDRDSVLLRESDGNQFFGYGTSISAPLNITGRDVSIITLVDALNFSCRRQLFVQTTPCDFQVNRNLCTSLIDDNREQFAEQTYCAVDINGRQWIAQNLDFGSRTDDNLGGGGFLGSCYSPSDASCSALGRLYTWDEVRHGNTGFFGPTDPDICPNGYRLPTTDEWIDLVNHIGGPANVAALMAENSWDGQLSSVDAPGLYNSTGFSAFPGGFYGSNDGSVQHILGPQGIGKETYFWAGDDFGNNNVRSAFHINEQHQGALVSVPRDFGAYCRCINQ